MSVSKGYAWSNCEDTPSIRHFAEIEKAKEMFGVIVNPIEFLELDEIPLSTAGREHFVYKSRRHPEDVIKITYERFGFRIEENLLYDEGAGEVVCANLLLKSNLSASDYVKRLYRQNAMFGDNVQILGIWTRENTFPQFIIKQPLRLPHSGSPTPKQEEIECYMEARGFTHLPANLLDNDYLKNALFYHEANNLFVADARPPNFVRTPDGALIPVDLICQRPDGKMKDFILKNCRR